MAKKTIKSTKTKTAKKTIKSTKTKTAKNPVNKQDNSMGIMLLVSIGLILLIYFGSTVSVDTHVPNNNVKLNNVKINSDTNNQIIISGKTYSSKEEAKEVLKQIPQTQRTDEEISFVEGYKE